MDVSVVAQSNWVVVCLVSTVERVDGLFSEDKHTYTLGFMQSGKTLCCQ